MAISNLHKMTPEEKAKALGKKPVVEKAKKEDKK